MNVFGIASSSKDDLLVCLLSRSSSKLVIASAAEAIAARRAPRSRKNSRSQKATDFELTVDHLDGILEGMATQIHNIILTNSW